MSTQAGGAADKLGNRHEALWGVAAMLRVLAGQASFVHIEELGQHGAEFYLQTTSGREYWQAKRQVSKQKDWTISLLRSEGVLAYFRHQTAQGHRCVFASVSDAVDLRSLAENARDIPAWHEFQAHVLSTKQWHKPFSELNSLMGFADEEATYRFLRQIRVENAAERTLEQTFLLPCLASRFVDTPSTVLSALIDYYETSVHQTLTAEDILRHLTKEPHSFKERTFDLNPLVIDRVQSITSTYVAGQRSGLIGRHAIKRQLASDITKRLLADSGSSNTIIAADSGGGKSAALLQIVEELQDAGMPVLAWRIDTLGSPESINSTLALGSQLGLPESPAIVLAKAHPGKPVALVIDQLDFVSAYSGRRAEMFDVIAALGHEVAGLRQMGAQVHLVMACRRVDFANDSRIRALLPDNRQPDTLSTFGPDEVKQAITRAGGSHKHLSKPQIKLLQEPQNLALYVHSGLVAHEKSAFLNQRDLLGAYWDAKKAIIIRRGTAWLKETRAILKMMTHFMSDRQMLVVPNVKFDASSPDLLGLLVSEGLLRKHPNGYGFSHESFFDHFFAIDIAESSTDFVDTLVQDPLQDLFRRTQLRQVLAHLRDADRSLYLSQIQKALQHEGLRSHLKLLVLGMLTSLTEPDEKEVEVLLPLLEGELGCRAQETLNPNQLQSRAWALFFASKGWLPLLQQRDIVQGWLCSHHEPVVRSVVNLLRFQARHHPDDVATLVESFIGQGAPWDGYLRSIIEQNDLWLSRPFFDLFLRLLDNGTLDEARRPHSSNGTFWSMTGDLVEYMPEWCAEVIAQWLDRQTVRARQNNLLAPQLQDRMGPEKILACARGGSVAFLHYVLPAILRVAEAFADRSSAIPHLDRVWFGHDAHRSESLPHALLKGTIEALRHTASQDETVFRACLETLHESPLAVARHLLQQGRSVLPASYANETITCAIEDLDRLAPSSSESILAIILTPVETCSPYCDEGCFRQLEEKVRHYDALFSPTEDNSYPRRSYFIYKLLCALAPDRCRTETKTRLEQLRKIYDPAQRNETRGRSEWKTSPISSTAAAEMSDSQWLEAIKTHHKDDKSVEWHNGEFSWAADLAMRLREQTIANPSRFAQMAMKLPQECNPIYLTNILYGLKESKTVDAQKLAVADFARSSNDPSCLLSALGLLEGVVGELSQDAITFIQNSALKNEDPAAADESWEDAELQSLNCVRGRALVAVSALLSGRKVHFEAFRDVIAACIDDPSLAVRAAATWLLPAVAEHDLSLAKALFVKLLMSDENILQSRHAEEFLLQAMYRDPHGLECVVEDMFVSGIEEVRQLGGKAACLGALHHPKLELLAAKALSGDAKVRRGVAEIAARALHHSEYRRWSERLLLRLFDDDSEEVRMEAATAFQEFQDSSGLRLRDYEELISQFLDSRAFADDPSHLLQSLDEAREPVPDVILRVCSAFIARCADRASDISTSLAADEVTMNSLVFRAHAQLEEVSARRRALDLIDQMCLAGLSSTSDQLEKHER